MRSGQCAMAPLLFDEINCQGRQLPYRMGEARSAHEIQSYVLPEIFALQFYRKGRHHVLQTRHDHGYQEAFIPETGLEVLSWQPGNVRIPLDMADMVRVTSEVPNSAPELFSVDYWNLLDIGCRQNGEPPVQFFTWSAGECSLVQAVAKSQQRGFSRQTKAPPVHDKQAHDRHPKQDKPTSTPKSEEEIPGQRRKTQQKEGVLGGGADRKNGGDRGPEERKKHSLSDETDEESEEETEQDEDEMSLKKLRKMCGYKVSDVPSSSLEQETEKFFWIVGGLTLSGLLVIFWLWWRLPSSPSLSPTFRSERYPETEDSMSASRLEEENTDMYVTNNPHQANYIEEFYNEPGYYA